MENSKKLPVSKKSINNKLVLEHQLKATLVDVFLSKHLVNPKLAVAFSGGLDSCVLLHLLAAINKTLPFQLSAHHVHHGLSVNADAWADFCALTCANLRVPLTISKVKINKNSGLGVEATAREARYSALLSTDAQFICLAHHQDDQAETLLLQLARGAGVKGLAGMAAVSGKLLRPLLDVPRSHLVAYAKQHQLTWIEDESNTDTTFDRNFMRHKVLPILEESYPSIRQTFGRSAQHMAQASNLLDELAALDAANCAYIAGSKQLQLQTLAQLSQARVNNVLRWWLAQLGAALPSAMQLQQISQQLLQASADANILIKLSANLVLRRFQGNAYLVNGLPAVDASMCLEWRSEEAITLPDQTRLLFSQQLGQGIALRHMASKKLTIRYRQGGETIKPQANRPTRRLNALLQTIGMPPWQRECLPLIWLDDVLATIPNVAVDAGLQAGSDEMGLAVSWLNSINL